MDKFVIKKHRKQQDSFIFLLGLLKKISRAAIYQCHYFSTQKTVGQLACLQI